MSEKISKKEMILITAKEMFIKYGPRRTTIDEICQKSNVSKMTFYKYYKNRDNLIKIIKDLIFQEGVDKFNEIKELDITFEEKMIRFGSWKREVYSGYDEDLIMEIASDIYMEDKFNDLLIDFYTEAQEKGEMAKEIDPRLLILFSKKITDVYEEGKWKDTGKDFIEIGFQLRSILFYGILPR